MNKKHIFIQTETEKNWLSQAFFFSIFFMLLSVILIRICMKKQMDSNDLLSTNSQMFFNIMFQASLLASGLLPALLFKKELPLKEKLKLKDWKTSYLATAAAIQALLLPLLVAVNYSVYLILPRYGLSFEFPKLAELIQNSTPPQLAAAIFLSVIVAPISEELFFRRIIFGFMAGILGPAAACVAASALFAAFHSSIFQFPALFILGASFQILYIKYRSLYPAIILHAINNALSITLILLKFH